MDTTVTTIDHLLNQALRVALLIERGDPTLRNHVADYGRCLVKRADIPDATRCGFAAALTQPGVYTTYAPLDDDLNRQPPTVRDTVRNQIAIAVSLSLRMPR